MEAFLKFYDPENKKSKHTIKTLKTSINRIEKLLNKSIDKWKIKDMIPSLIDSLNSNSAKIQTLTTMNRFLEWKGKENKAIKNKLNELIKERTDKEKSQEMTEKQKNNWVNYQDLKSKIESDAQKYLNNKKAWTKYRNFLMLSLFVLMPPARIGNYLDMLYKTQGKKKIKSYPKKNNYITKIDDKYMFVFNNFKTSKYLDQVIYVVENETLNKLINKWFTDYAKNKKKFLTNFDGSELSQTNFTSSLKNISREILGKTLNLNLLRQIYLTWYAANNASDSIEEKEKHLAIVGQTVKYSRYETYAKKDKIEENKESDP